MTDQPPSATWEIVQSSDAERLDRIAVDGGWLYRSTLHRFGPSAEPLMMSMAFVPEPAPAPEPEA